MFSGYDDGICHVSAFLKKPGPGSSSGLCLDVVADVLAYGGPIAS